MTLFDRFANFTIALVKVSQVLNFVNPAKSAVTIIIPHIISIAPQGVSTLFAMPPNLLEWFLVLRLNLFSYIPNLIPAIITFPSFTILI